MGDINFKLSRDEALVLFEWLAARMEAETGVTPVTAEDVVMWRMRGQLDQVLVEPLKSNYTELVNAARERVLASA